MAQSLTQLVGRENELTEIRTALKQASSGRGQILLIAGEAGHGKTHLARHSLQDQDLCILSQAADHAGSVPYGPIIGVLRAFLRADPKGFKDFGPLKPYLAHLLPELGDAPKDSDPSTLTEAIRTALGVIANLQPTVIFLDDLHWADNATLELLPKLIGWIEEQPLLILGAYRNDEIPRGHPLRTIKNDLRRAKHLNEITIQPLDLKQTAELIANLLGNPPTPQFAETLHFKTHGVPFFLEELIATLEESNFLDHEKKEIDLLPGREIPIPEHVRDAILIRLDNLSPETKECLEIAAVAGQQFDFQVIADLTGNQSLDQAIQNGFIFQVDQQHGQFRHALTHEAIYEQINWSRVSNLHRQIAAKLEELGTPPAITAEHWYAGKEYEKARKDYVQSAMYSCKIHAYSDSVYAGKRAIDLWPEGEEEQERLKLLDKLGYCAQVSGSLNQAVQAWREAAEGYLQQEDHLNHALTHRSLAAVYALQMAWGRSQNARLEAVQSFLKAEDKQEAGMELLALSSHYHSAAQYSQAKEFSQQALDLAEEINNPTIKSRALGIFGSVIVRLGSPEEGLAKTQEGLSLALEHNLISAASDVYIRVAAAYEHNSDYKNTKKTYKTAISFCETHGLSPMTNLCLACAAVATLQTGDWQETQATAETVLKSKESSSPLIHISNIMLGILLGFRSENQAAQDLLRPAITGARDFEMINVAISGDWGLALGAWADNDLEETKKHALSILDHYSETEDTHYTISPLRFAATFFASIGDGTNTRRAADALARINNTLTNYETLAGLSHSLGATCLINDDREQAIQHFQKSLDLVIDKNLPICEGETRYWLGITLLNTGQTQPGIDMLTSAYHIFNSLEASVYTTPIIAALDQQGIALEDILGKRAAQKAKSAGLTKRQLEVLRLVAQGLSNQEIADELVLSPRTVEMHVGNVLAQLNSRSRAEAVAKAAELSLLK